MANIILKLIPNKWDARHFFSFLKKGERCPKDQHFLAHNNYKKEIKPGEFWECFIWTRRELEDKILFKVVPFCRVDVKKLKSERRRVEEFNRELAALEKLVGPDFEKVVFKANNIPFLLSKKTKEELSSKYRDFSFLVDPEGVLARPPVTRPQRPERGFSGPKRFSGTRRFN
jgi:hypothetical protein